MTLPFTISPMMHPTDHMSTENRKQIKLERKTKNTHHTFWIAEELTDLRVRSEESDTYRQRVYFSGLKRWSVACCFNHMHFQTCFLPRLALESDSAFQVFFLASVLGLSVYTAVAFLITFPVYVLSGKGCRLSLSLHKCQCMWPVAIKRCLPFANLSEAKRALVLHLGSSPHTKRQKSSNCFWTRRRIFLLTPPLSHLLPVGFWSLHPVLSINICGKVFHHWWN